VLVLVASCGFEAEIPPTTQMPIDATAMIETDAPPDASPASLCAARYGGALEFDLCDASPTACRFYVDTNGGTCAALCASFGGTCTEAYDGDCAGISTTVRPCTNALGDQVCNCKP
jgi:hypothetical protein